jgi:membrane protease YdiL (CAAX protease family)
VKKIALVYLIFIILAETLTVFVGLVPGSIVYAALIPILLSHYVISEQATCHRLLIALSLVPLLRMLSLILPSPQLPVAYWNGLVGGALLIAIGFASRLLRLSREELGLTLHFPAFQLLVGIAGIPLGFFAYLFSTPWPNAGIYHSVSFALFAVFSGIVEELIFRGFLQNAAQNVFGEHGIFYSSMLYAAMYMGTLSAGYVVVIGFSGLYAAWSTQRTHSLFGAILLRTFLLSGMLLIWPSVHLF